MQHKRTAVSRRDFVTASAAVSAAAMMSSLGSNFAHAQGSDKIKVGLVGCGGRGRGAAANCVESAPNVQIVAVGDVFQNQAEGARNEFAKRPKDQYDIGDRCFWGLDNYQKVIDSGVDMVILATPPGFRPIHFEAAIKAGKHVFFEKPVAVDPVGVRTVIKYGDIAKEKGLGVVTGTQRRHQKSYVETIKRIHDGAIGDILHMSVYWNGGGIWWHAPRPGESDVEYQIRNWYHHNWLCGDQICEQHVHNLDVANWVLRAHPISAYAMGGRQLRDKLGQKGEIWDHFAVEYEYPNNVRVLSFCRHWAQSDDNISEFALGTNGTANPNNSIRPKNGQGWRFQGEETNPYVQEHTDLIASIRAGKPLNEARQVAESTLTAIIGRMSAYTGRKVNWDWAMEKSKLDLVPKDLDLKGKAPEIKLPQPDVDELV